MSKGNRSKKGDCAWPAADWCTDEDGSRGLLTALRLKSELTIDLKDLRVEAAANIFLYWGEILKSTRRTSGEHCDRWNRWLDVYSYCKQNRKVLPP